MPYRTGAERILYDGPELRLSQLDVEFADGDRVSWDTVRLLRSISVALVDSSNRVLALHRRRLTGQRWGWELPGSVIDDDEVPDQAAERELAELTGYRAGRLTLACGLQPAPRNVDGEHLLYVGREPERRAQVDGTAGGAAPWDWLPLGSVPERVRTGQIWDSATLVALLGLLAGAW